MKRIGNIYHLIYEMDNLRLADQNARRGKSHQSGVKLFDKDPEANLFALHVALRDKTYVTSAYQKRIIREPKQREISILPYIDRVAQHAIVQIIEHYFTSYFTADTYSSIPGRGIHSCSYALRDALMIIEQTTYYLQMDVEKFYPTVDHDILKAKLRLIFKDADLLRLLDGIIDSCPGLPIGNYLSQYFANFYLSPLDRFVKEFLKVGDYFRYADDLVALGTNSKELHQTAFAIIWFCKTHLNLTVKPKYIVSPVSAQGIDLVGYVHYHDCVYLRKSIKQRFARAVARRASRATIASYRGWAKHANCRNLIKKLLPNGHLTHDTNKRLQRI